MKEEAPARRSLQLEEVSSSALYCFPEITDGLASE